MKKTSGGILFSASDLMRFSGCNHATALDLAYLKGAELSPCEDSEDARLLQGQGDAHEVAYLEDLKRELGSVLEIDRGGLQFNAKVTETALREGWQAVFQGAFLSGNWGGWSDFLIRVDKPSELGAFSYEVTDTKLKRTVHPKHVLQLSLYSDLLEVIQGVAPEAAHVLLGDGRKVRLRLADYKHYASRVRQRFERFVEAPAPTRPVPCRDCGLCRWREHCDAVWQDQDSLYNIANVTRGQVRKLESQGLKTMEAVASSDGPVRGVAPDTLDRLRAQARLQHARKSGAPAFEFRPHQPGKGFDLLPKPEPGDVFYDIEGDPYFEGGLEYLHGLWFDGTFKAFWAHDHKAEAESLAGLLDFFRARLEAFPQARIYHYAPYEVTALRRLTTKYGIGEAFLDKLQSEQRFIDLYAVVRGCLIASEPNYSIKSMEVFYDLERVGEVKTAGGSVIAYEAWRDTGDQTILDEIEDYNRIDCVSTEKLRDWLVSIRPHLEWPVPGKAGDDKEHEEDEKLAVLRALLAVADLTEDHRELLFNLGMFHRREAKPGQWAVFDSVSREEEELLDDLDALGGLVAKGPAEPVKRSFQRTYSYPPQETKLRTGTSATVSSPDGAPATVTISGMDRPNRLVTVKAGPKNAHLLRDRLSLHPDWPLRTDVIAAALQDVIEDQCGARQYRAVDDLLNRRWPRLNGAGGDVLAGQDAVQGTIAAVLRMDQTVLPVQGPPGTGKTHVSARAILSLVKAGYRVGVASNSHEAIRNVLMGCLKAVPEMDLVAQPHMLHKISSASEDGYPADSPIDRVTSNDNAEGQGDIVGGTAFFFSRPNNIQAFDWLFVDEAGQVGLANMAAMGRAARNIVLVGDPQQLPQVIQGAHPEPANLSCLEWMLGGHATIPPERGIFLGTTRRMHPQVCGFISDQVYEGRLDSHPMTSQQKVSAEGYPSAGAFWVEVDHQGNAQISPEEVSAIATAANRLLTGTWTDKDGSTREIGPEDIIVVAPYNAQVNALREALPDAIRVGTVDKFQGQEAPICLVSMTASSAEETARGMDFLFSLNRINVAVSRAKGLVLVFGSPRLREAKCETLEQVRLVNTVCALGQHTFIKIG